MPELLWLRKPSWSLSRSWVLFSLVAVQFKQINDRSKVTLRDSLAGPRTGLRRGHDLSVRWKPVFVKAANDDNALPAI